MLVRLCTALVTLSALVALGSGCPGGLRPVGDDDDDDDDDEEIIDTGFPAPADDLTGAVGAPETLDVATWNIRNFPCGNASFSEVCRSDADLTASLVADLVTSMALDLVVVQEIADEAAWDELVQRLPHHEGVLSTDTYGDGSYQKIGMLYDARVLDAGTANLLFQGDFSFPRPALQVPFTWTAATSSGEPLTFLAIGVHLKAGEDEEDFERRGESIASMAAYMANLVDGAGEDNIIALGDYNETLTDGAGLANFAPLRDPARYALRTEANAFSDEVSFLPSGVILDHIVTSAALADEAANRTAVIPRLDFQIERYRDRLSDHVPVTLTLDP